MWVGKRNMVDSKSTKPIPSLAGGDKANSKITAIKVISFGQSHAMSVRVSGGDKAKVSVK